MKKLEKLIVIYGKISSLFEVVGNPKLQEIGRSFSDSMKKIESHISDGSINTSPFVKGLEQGLTDLPLLIYELEDGDKKNILNNIFSIIESTFPDFFTKKIAKIEKIKQAGVIKTESEYNLVRLFVDVAEGDPNRKHDLNILYELIDSYEGK